MKRLTRKVFISLQTLVIYLAADYSHRLSLQNNRYEVHAGNFKPSNNLGFSY
jgi:hypothetical protein